MRVHQREIGKVWRGAPGAVWWVLGFFPNRHGSVASTHFVPEDLSAAVSWGVAVIGSDGRVRLTDLGKQLHQVDGPKIQKPPT